MKIALLGNVTLDFLAQDFRRAGHDVYVPSGFDTWRQEALDHASGLHAFAPDAVLLVMEGGVPPDDEGILGALADAQERVHPGNHADAQERVPPVRVVVPDIAALAAETPGFWDARMRTLAAMPFSLAGLKAIEDEFFFALDAAPKRLDIRLRNDLRLAKTEVKASAPVQARGEPLDGGAGIALNALRVDGGASANDFLMQFQSDVIGVPVERPECVETTALGAAYLAGLAVGFWDGPSELKANVGGLRRFTPAIGDLERAAAISGWHAAVARVRSA